jgi:hypothetical protein
VQFDATVPVIIDRVHQARVVNALEARFEPRSYGFRPGRGCQDAIQAVHATASGKSAKRLWALDADLASAFDLIAHDHILNQIGAFPARGMIRAWLKAGVVEQGRLHRTEDGVPQGSLCAAAHKPPCGVPDGVAVTVPSSDMTPAAKNFRISARTRLSVTRRRTCSIKRP